ncbi:MAG: class I SAM-dependent methyltransferase [Halanaeroarchaeum sp.]
MNHHTFDPEAAAKLEDVDRYRYLSRDELVGGLAVDESDAVVDLGSGTGFYTRDVAQYAGTVHAVDVQSEMHEHFRAVGRPDNVDLVTAGVADLPLADDAVDGAYSTMTFHEFVSGDSLAEVRRVLRSGARFVVVDWSATGDGERGPPLEARVGPDGAASYLDGAGFDVHRSDDRPETFYVLASAP